MDERDDASASGFIRSGFEGVSAVFTEVEILRPNIMCLHAPSDMASGGC